MANVKITQLDPADLPLVGTEEAEIVQGGINKRVAISELGGGSVPTLQEVTVAGRTFTETDTATDYSLEVFGGTGTSKYFNLSILSSAVTSLFNFTKLATTIRNYTSTTNISELLLNSSGVTLKKTSPLGTNQLLVGISGIFTSSNIFRTPNDFQQSAVSAYTLGMRTVVVSANTTAEATINYSAQSATNITFTDPVTGGTSTQGIGYTVYAHSGTITVGGVVYPEGTYLFRYYKTSSYVTEILKSNLIITANTTAFNDGFYSANGTITVTDPTPVTNKGYIVHVISGTSTIGGVGYTSGALVYRFYDGAVWISTDMSAGTSTAQRSTATSGTESAPDTSNEVVFIHEAGVTASLTYNFPPNPIDKQKVTVMSVGGITALTLSAVVGTIINTITTLAGGGCATYMYLASQTKWYKIG